MGESCFGQCAQKLPKNWGKALFCETYFEMSNINQKPLILSQDMLVMKFELKNWANLVLGHVYENCPKIEEKRYFMKLTSKRVISTENPPKLS